MDRDKSEDDEKEVQTNSKWHIICVNLQYIIKNKTTEIELAIKKLCLLKKKKTD